MVSEEFNKRFFAQQVMYNFKVHYKKEEVGEEVVVTAELLQSGKYQMERKYYNNPINNKKGVVIYPAIYSRKLKNPFDGTNLVVPAIIRIED